MRVQSIKDVEKIFLEPSFKYLVENGLESTSVRDLCKAMGVSSGSIYYWFEDKEDVYASVLLYGIQKVSHALFKVLFDKIDDLQVFFGTFLDEVDVYMNEFRVIFQATASPRYGYVLRERGNSFKDVYEQYIDKLSKMLECPADMMRPIVYKIITALVDYVLWEDRPTSEMLLDDIHKTMMMKLSLYKQENR